MGEDNEDGDDEDDEDGDDAGNVDENDVHLLQIEIIREISFGMIKYLFHSHGFSPHPQPLQTAQINNMYDLSLT